LARIGKPLGVAYVRIRGDRTKLKGDLDAAKVDFAAAGKHFAMSVGVAAAAFTAVLIPAIKKSIDAASDLEETVSKFNVVFGDQKKAAEKWAADLVDGYAMSTREAKQYLSSVQDLLVPMGMQAQSAAILSNEIVKLSADLGSFNNLPTAQVMLDIQSALVGNFETMKKYGVILNETVVKQEALNMGLWDGKGAVEASVKAQVAYELMLKSSKAALGDMERTSGSYANQTKKLHANIEDLSVILGNELLPLATDTVKMFNDWIKANQGLIQQNISEYFDKMATSLNTIKGIYDSVPPSLLSTGGAGIVGAILFGGMGPAKLAMAIVGINEGMKTLGFGLGDLVKSYREAVTAIDDFWQALMGNRKGFKEDIENMKAAAELSLIPQNYITITPGADDPNAGGKGGGDSTEVDQAKLEGISYGIEQGLEYIAAGNEAELKLEREKQAQLNEWMLEIWQSKYNSKVEWLNAETEFANASIRLEEAQIKKSIELEAFKTKQKKKYQQEAVKNAGNALQLLGQQQKWAFDAYKVFAASEAVVSGVQAAVAAFAAGMSVGGPYAPAIAAAYAAASIAWTAAQVHAITSASFSGGGGGTSAPSVGAVGTYNADPTLGTPISLDPYDAPEERGTTTFNINGPIIGNDEFVDDLINRINDAREDRDVTVNYG